MRKEKQEGNILEELIAEILVPMTDVIVMKDRADESLFLKKVLSLE